MISPEPPWGWLARHKDYRAGGGEVFATLALAFLAFPFLGIGVCKRLYEKVMAALEFKVLFHPSRRVAGGIGKKRASDVTKSDPPFP